MNIEDLANYALAASDDDEILELQAIVAGLLFLSAEEVRLSKIRTHNPSRLYLCRPQLLPNPRVMTPWTQLYESYDNRSYITTMMCQHFIKFSLIVVLQTSGIRHQSLVVMYPGRDSPALELVLSMLLVHWVSPCIFSAQPCGKSHYSRSRLIPTTVNRYLDFALNILHKTLRGMPEAAIHFPDLNEIIDDNLLIRARHSKLLGGFGSIDGLTFSPRGVIISGYSMPPEAGMTLTCLAQSTSPSMQDHHLVSPSTNPSSSSTYKADGARFNFYTGRGTSTMKGFISQDDLHIGNFSIRGQNFGEITGGSRPVFSFHFRFGPSKVDAGEVTFDGIDLVIAQLQIQRIPLSSDFPKLLTKARPSVGGRDARYLPWIDLLNVHQGAYVGHAQLPGLIFFRLFEPSSLPLPPPLVVFYTWIIWMPCFITITEEQEHSERDRHGEECRCGGTNDAFVPPLDPAAIHRTECNRSWERYSECTVSCWPMETDMASVSISAPSEPAAAHEAADDTPAPPAGEIEHHSEHNASFLEMTDDVTSPSVHPRSLVLTSPAPC
ncbi:hypothetical protein P692DRAFT_20869012 [Suillus brevipes Sb2]|nr:hypothetical protein P692DRAFT_20869012 [Suillus brevipes Sb2]